MTLKKSKRAQSKKRGQALFQRGQAIFEYFILTTAVVAVVLVFAGSPDFQNIKSSCETAFNQAVGQILAEGGSSGGVGSPGGDSPAGTTTTMTLESSFENEGLIPIEYTGDNPDTPKDRNINPPLSIGGIPKEAKSLALIVEDHILELDGTIRIFVHWVVFDIPVVSKIKADTVPGTQGKNDWGYKNYFGPYPPEGQEHRYYFKIYALDTWLGLEKGLKEGATKEQLREAMGGHVLAYVELIGLYKR